MGAQSAQSCAKPKQSLNTFRVLMPFSFPRIFFFIFHCYWISNSLPVTGQAEQSWTSQRQWCFMEFVSVNILIQFQTQIFPLITQQALKSERELANLQLSNLFCLIFIHCHGICDIPLSRTWTFCQERM